MKIKNGDFMYLFHHSSAHVKFLMISSLWKTQNDYVDMKFILIINRSTFGIVYVHIKRLMDELCMLIVLRISLTKNEKKRRLIKEIVFCPFLYYIICTLTFLKAN